MMVDDETLDDEYVDETVGQLQVILDILNEYPDITDKALFAIGQWIALEQVSGYSSKFNSLNRYDQAECLIQGLNEQLFCEPNE
jgi:hypothetical protein